MPRKVTPQQRIVINPRTHRASDVLGDIYLPPKPKGGESWWLQHQQDRIAFSQQAEKELPRMAGSRDGSTGLRRAVDEIRQS